MDELVARANAAKDKDRLTDITWEAKRRLDIMLLFSPDSNARTRELCDIVREIEQIVSSLVELSRRSRDEAHPALKRLLQVRNSVAPTPMLCCSGL